MYILSWFFYGNDFYEVYLILFNPPHPPIDTSLKVSDNHYQSGCKGGKPTGRMFSENKPHKLWRFEVTRLKFLRKVNILATNDATSTTQTKTCKLLCKICKYLHRPGYICICIAGGSLTLGRDKVVFRIFVCRK